MIQRIQTLYLLAATACMALLLTMPIIRFLVMGQECTLTAFGIKILNQSIESTLQMGTLAVICAIIPFMAIFFYRRRIVQMRLCVGAMILTAALQLFVCYYVWRSDSIMSGFGEMVETSITPTAILPLIGVISLWLAYRGIYRDEMLVKSIDRIR